MVCSIYKKSPILLFCILFFTLYSCEKDTNLLDDHVLDEVAVVDDNFRIPANRQSILDVLSNDIHISSENTRIISISDPSNGWVKVNEDNTLTYAPDSANIEEPAEEEQSPDEASSEESGGNANSAHQSDNPEETAENETADDEEDAEDAEDADDTSDDNADTQEDSGPDTATEETGDEADSQDTAPDEPATEEAPAEETVPDNNTSTDSNSEANTTENTNPQTNEDKTPSDVNTDGQEETTESETMDSEAAEQHAPEPENTEEQDEPSNTNESTNNGSTDSEASTDEESSSESSGSEENDTDSDQGEDQDQNQQEGSTEESTDEGEQSDTETEEGTSEEEQEETNEEMTEEDDSESEEPQPVQEDTFTYTTETENDDGSVTTETATVTVEVGSDTEEESVEAPEPEQESESRSETDYWRDPVIAGSRIKDEKYYDLDTGNIYSKEVSLKRGQIENYIEHENCPQRIKDKWGDRVEITTGEVNGSQDGLQKIFDAHPRGTLFYLRAGVYQDQKNAVLDNDQDIVGEYGAILDGSGIQGNSEESTRAIRSMERGYICNLKVRKYPTWNDPQRPKNPRGAALEVIQNGAILNCDIHSENVAISLIYGSKALWNKITAGRMGMYGYGSHDTGSPNRTGSVVKYNELYDCNFNGYDGEHEAGGAKFVQIDGVIWSHNYLHDIPSGGGIWQDGENRNSDIYNNVIIKTHRGIFSEISYTSNIHHNTIEYGTGFGAIYMSNSSNEKVHHNFVRWCRNGIAVRDKDRGTSKIYPGQAYRGLNNEIYDNHVWQRPDPSTWTHGVAGLYDGHIDPNNTSNRWRDNHYYIDDNAEGSELFSEQPYTLMFMYSKLAAESDHRTISWEKWRNESGDTNATLEFERFF